MSKNRARRGSVVVLLTVIVAMALLSQAVVAEKLQFMFWGSAGQARIVYDMIHVFQGRNPGITIDSLLTPSGGGHYEKLKVMTATGTAPDVAWVEMSQFAEFAQTGMLEDLTPYLERSTVVAQTDYFPRAVKAFSYQNQLYAISRDLSPAVIFYNVDLFNERGLTAPPRDWTWSLFSSMGRKLSVDRNGDGAIDIWGIANYVFEAALWQAGGDLFDDEFSPTRVVANSPQTEVAVEWLKSLQTDSVAPPQFAGASFDKGTGGMYQIGRWMVQAFRQSLPFAWDVATLPAGPAGNATMHYGSAYVMPRDGKNKAAAWRFIEFMAGPEGQAMDVEVGRSFPTVRQVATSRAFRDATPPKNNVAFIEAIGYARRLAIIPEFAEVTALFNRHFGEAACGRVPVRDALENLQRGLQAIVDSRQS